LLTDKQTKNKPANT